eukprot:GFUD01042138.1.p1 GENE.GFUD01042138.1~~GFUD01042138.1.p1  ORF type:complete len:493 (-),score=119.52 GFUD01042138.1:111-1541(-)
MAQVGNTSIQDIQSSLIGLPPGFQICLGWNPETNTDIGWLNLKPGVERDFRHFQLRDFNCNQQNVNEVTLEMKKVIEEGVLSEFENPANARKVEGDFEKIGDSVERDTMEKLDIVTTKKDNIKFATEDKKVFEVTPRYFSSSSSLVKCSYCYRKVKDLAMHEVKCPSKHSKGTNRVKCPQCNLQLLRAGFPTHLKNHTLARIACPHCNRVILQKTFDLHQLKCLSKNRSDAIKKAVEGLGISAVDVTDEKEMANIEEPLPNGKLSAVDDNYDEIILPCDEVDKVVCRLKFKMMDEGKLLKKIIKSLSLNSVNNAMKKFSSFVGKNVDDLEFLSQDCVLDGEELAGAIDRGVITVRLRCSDDLQIDQLEMSSDLITAVDLDEIRRDLLNKSAGFSPRYPSAMCPNQQENQDQDMPRLPSVVTVKISPSEDISVDETEKFETNCDFEPNCADSETEQYFETNSDLGLNAEHVVDFSKF